MLCIRDILVRIRIRTQSLGHGSGFESGSCSFISGFQDANKKLAFLRFFAYCFFKAHLHQFSKRKKSENSINQGFSYFFCMIMEGSGSRSRSGSVQIMSDPDPGGLKVYGSGSTELDGRRSSVEMRRCGSATLIGLI